MSDRTDPQWHKKRSTVIGASEIAALYGVQQPYQLGLFALWHVKAGLSAPPPVDGERVDWGNDLEEAIARVAARRNNWTITKAEWLRDPECPGLGCTPDYYIESDPRAVLEIKNLDWLQHKKKWDNDEPPLHILLQVQVQLACTGLQTGHVAAMVSGNQLETYQIERRDTLIADIRKRVKAFWQSIEENKPPPIDGSDSAFFVLRELTPELTDDNINMDGDNRFPTLCAELAEAQARKKAAEKDEAALKAELEYKLGEHKRAWCAGWNASFVENKGSAGTLVTEAMVGTHVGGRKPYRYIQIKESKP